MCQLNLSPEETKALHEVLDRYRKDLAFELSNTEALEYREKLKEHEQTVMKIAENLSIAEAARQPVQ